MDKSRLFETLAAQEPSVLLDLLSVAYDEMEHNQRQIVFGQYVQKLPPEPVDGKALLEKVEMFRRESLAEEYYAPFNINSKNWTHIPRETNQWFDRLGNLLQASAQLTMQEDHLHAVICFGILYELIDRMEDGEEIVFGDEIGSWMIPGDEKKFIAAYMTSLAVTATPEEFAAVTLPLLQRDSWQSFSTHAYASAVYAANAAQRAHLEAEIQRQKIRTEPKSQVPMTIPLPPPEKG